jgi:hypothetical protein
MGDANGRTENKAGGRECFGLYEKSLQVVIFRIISWIFFSE